jgi:ParB family transcriptional regulator, chromosome partitioning protein
MLVFGMNQAILQIPTLDIEPNPLQPRGIISHESIEELVKSIEKHGILEPLVIAKTPAGYQIIAGERRWRSAKLLKLKTVPAIVKETTPQGMLEMAIVENVQRKDLNPIERGKAFLRLKDEFHLNYDQIAERISKSVPYVVNSIRLLSLPDALKDGLLSGLITEGHARALSGIPDTRLMIEAYKIVLREKASVRRAEDVARRMKKRIEEGMVPITKENLHHFLKSKLDAVGESIQNRFDQKSTKVKIVQSNMATKVTIQFSGPVDQRTKQLESLYKIICGKKIKLLDSSGSKPPTKTKKKPQKKT